MSVLLLQPWLTIPTNKYSKIKQDYHKLKIIRLEQTSGNPNEDRERKESSHVRINIVRRLELARSINTKQTW